MTSFGEAWLPLLVAVDGHLSVMAILRRVIRTAKITPSLFFLGHAVLYYRISNLSDHEAEPHAKYRLSEVASYWLRHFSHPSLILQGLKCQIWRRFSTSVVFESPSLRNGATYLKSGITSAATITDLCLFQIRHSSAHSPLKTMGSINLKIVWKNVLNHH